MGQNLEQLFFGGDGFFIKLELLAPNWIYRYMSLYMSLYVPNPGVKNPNPGVEGFGFMGPTNLHHLYADYAQAFF